MWFPYSLPTSFRIEGDRHRANDSQVDDSPREFLVACQLRNPISNSWSVELHLEETRTLKWKEADGNQIQLSLFPDEDGRLSEVVCKLLDNGLQSAVGRSHAAISNLLDFWSGLSGRGFSVAGLRVADFKYDARWRAMPHWPSALELPFEIPENIPASFWPVAQLYREGRTSSKDRYRFLCCQAVIMRWARAEEPFAWRKQSCPDVSELAETSISREVMALAGAKQFVPHLEGLTIEDLATALESWKSQAIDFIGSASASETLDDFTTLQMWAAIANVADIAAHTVLSRTIVYWREIAPAKDRHCNDAALANQVAS
ncbi:MAG TPA: methylamine utilization protein MauJ [Pirellulaceae bacterium]|nr:methylamine utilization protein MauJ [Hyphomicrobiaceae bacterium]MCC0011092.1 methylamine utilization protein MauJ [Hyphomicrobiaceae bacterium]HRX78955.1 methylamine utilization protein MauJ [Pirellulaceae bacterium]